VRLISATIQTTEPDLLPPVVLCTAQPTALWPPNHKMKEVAFTIDASDACDAPQDLIMKSISVSSSELDNALSGGDGNTTGDVNGYDGYFSPVDLTNLFTFDPDSQTFKGTISLRAERDGDGPGRDYTIRARIADQAGNIGETICTVLVSHDRSRK